MEERYRTQMTKANGYQESVTRIARSQLTPAMRNNAIILLSIARDTGALYLSAETIRHLWTIRTHGTMVKYLARMYAAQVLNYSTMRDGQVSIFFLGFGEPSEAGFAPPETRSSASSGATQPVVVTQVAPHWAGL